MNTQEFLSLLQAQPGKPLVFEYAEGQRVGPGYHVTEVMNVTYESMDCGGNSHFWRETVVQLQGPGAKDRPEFMSTDKFLGIYQQVVAAVPVRPDSEIRFQYGDAEIPAIHYHVGSVSQDGAIVVRLSPPGVACKPALAKASGCCTPAAVGASGANLANMELEVVNAKGGCCD